MTTSDYYTATGGHPPQTQLLTDRAVMTNAYAFIPKGTMRDITLSYLPLWDKTSAWVLARPLSGFAESFSHYLTVVAPGGGSTNPDPEPGVQAVLFVTGGTGQLTVAGAHHMLRPGSYVYLPPVCDWQLSNPGDAPLQFHWIRKRYCAVDGIAQPDLIITHEGEATVSELPGTDGGWTTTRFVAPDDMAHDMHVNIVSFAPGAVIPFMETHVMEHGLYVLEGKAVYRLNQDWVEVEAGDYMWLRAFCPQACYAGGPGPFRYLLYKDVNRHMPLGLPQIGG